MPQVKARAPPPIHLLTLDIEHRMRRCSEFQTTCLRALCSDGCSTLVRRCLPLASRWRAGLTPRHRLPLASGNRLASTLALYARSVQRRPLPTCPARATERVVATTVDHRRRGSSSAINDHASGASEAWNFAGRAVALVSDVCSIFPCMRVIVDDGPVQVTENAAAVANYDRLALNPICTLMRNRKTTSPCEPAIEADAARSEIAQMSMRRGSNVRSCLTS